MNFRKFSKNRFEWNANLFDVGRRCAAFEVAMTKNEKVNFARPSRWPNSDKNPPFLPHHDGRNGTNQILFIWISGNFVWFDEEFRRKLPFFSFIPPFFLKKWIILICKWDANEWHSRWTSIGFPGRRKDRPVICLVFWWNFGRNGSASGRICTGPPDGRGPDYSNEPNVHGLGPAKSNIWVWTCSVRSLAGNLNF